MNALISTEEWRTIPTVPCAFCGKEFLRSKVKIKRAEANGSPQYCCHSHKALALFKSTVPDLNQNSDLHRVVTLVASLNPRRIKMFMDSIDVKSSENECWPWRGKSIRKGYGVTSIGRYRPPAHHVAFILAGNVFQKGHIIRHTCDNPPCCNPKHLLPGTAADNSSDMVLRGRNQKGSKRSNAKLTEKQALAILHAPGTPMALATYYGVSRSVIRNIKKRKTWRHI